MSQPLADLQTPCLVLDERRLDANIARMKQSLNRFAVAFRPHLKTTKAIEIAQKLMTSPAGPCTVSTLAEAEAFAAAGVQDICYAVGIVPAKLPRIAALRDRGADVCVLLDNEAAARAVAAASRACGSAIPALIEIDCDGKRSGVRPDQGARLVSIGRILHEEGASLRGVLTHAGASYQCRTNEALAAFAEQERAAAVSAADQLRAARLPCPVVSVGSTPTALSARDLTGVTEVRAGVFAFFDLVMAGTGVCAIEEIALSVLASVIGEAADGRGWIIDAGWMALSRDRGAQGIDYGYGLVCDCNGEPMEDLIVAETSQEHGLVVSRMGRARARLRMGERIRIMPNHACATAAQHELYHVLAPDGASVRTQWRRLSGW